MLIWMILLEHTPVPHRLFVLYLALVHHSSLSILKSQTKRFCLQIGPIEVDRVLKHSKKI
jgi:hypothetical protein